LESKEIEMKHLKILGLAAVVSTALLTFAGTASATELTSPAGIRVPTGSTIHAVSEGHAVLDPPFGKIECNSTVEGATANETGTSINGAISTLNFTNCTNGAVVAVIKTGTFSITSSGGGNGTLTSNGAEVTVELLGVHCLYSTAQTPLGTVTGSGTTGGTATLDIAATLLRTGGRSGNFCGTSARWTGSYSITKPDPLFID
jgi:hypothetical protein